MPEPTLSVLSVLQKSAAVSADKEPMKPNQYDLTGGVPIIDIPRGTRGVSPDFVIYDNATSPDSRILIQGRGNVYYGVVRDDELEFEVQKITDTLPFGVIGVYPDDYYIANRAFVDSLETRLG
jgi:hypothetical protein